MTQPSFDLPPKCANCKPLRRCIENYFATVTGYTVAAEKVSTRLEVAASAVFENEADDPTISTMTVGTFAGAAILQKAELNQVTGEIQNAHIFCDGTADPTSAKLQGCTLIDKALN